MCVSIRVEHDNFARRVSVTHINGVFLVTADRKNGVTNVKYKRPLQTNDSNLDRPIEAGNDLSVIAAIGPLNSKGEANAHSHDGMGTNYEDMKIDFGSRVRTDCFFVR